MAIDRLQWCKPSDCITGDMSEELSAMLREQAQQAKQGGKVGYTPSVATTVQAEKNIGCVLFLREIKYQREVLAGMNVQMMLIKQMAMMDHALKRRKVLYMSIRELIDTEAYKYWSRRDVLLYRQFDEMVRRGYMIRATRERKYGRGRTVIWGLSGEGKRLMKEYYAYLGGAHDEASWTL